MGYKAKVRLGITVNGKERELLSVRDRRENGVVIMTPKPKYYIYPDGKYVPYVEQHYSIHPSKNGLDLSITQKTRLADGKSVSVVGYVANLELQFSAPVLAARLPVFSDSGNIFNPRMKDTFLNVGSYETAKSTLFYSIFVTHKGFDHRSIRQKCLRYVFIEQTRYCVVVIITYLDVPSWYAGRVMPFMTSAPIHNEIRESNHWQIDIGSMPPHEITDTHWSMMRVLQSQLINELKPEFDDLDDNQRRIMDTMLDYWTAMPGEDEMHFLS